jgi:hypothetical protein
VRWLLPLLAIPLAAGAPLITFEAIDDRSAAASDEYRQLWCAEGARIVAAMERVTGFRYPGGRVEAIVGNGMPMTVFGGRSIRLKASYPLYYKRATLVHELGNRLAFTMPRTADLDEHRLLYLFLYDVWSDLYGLEFANRMVVIERRIAGSYDYALAWDWALGMSRAERQARLAELRSQSQQRTEGGAASSMTRPSGCDGGTGYNPRRRS